jgi:hypothetical protein
LALGLLFYVVNSPPDTMKTTLLIITILCSVAALGQSASSISNNPQPLRISGHPEYASQGTMATEHSLVGGGASTYTYAQGERPLWEFGEIKPQIPLGDVARSVRKEKLTAKKAEIIFEKQGS